MVKSRSAEWQEAYQDALRETDQEKLMTKISAAEVALFSRLQQMHEPICKDEVIAIYDAVHVLRILSYDLYTREKREHLTQMPRQSASRQSNLASATTLNISCAPHPFSGSR